MQNLPLISICIPTYNRDKFLDECLASLTRQFRDKEIYENVEIVVVDNRSIDKTEEVFKKYAKKFKNIFYFKNKRNISIGKGIIEVGKYTRGKYIWFCSDDDTHVSGSLKKIYNVIRVHEPDIIYSNLSEYSRDMTTLIHKNSLGINRNYYIHGRKKLFEFLNSKFFYAIDWYTAFYSNVIVNRKMYDECYLLSKKYSTKYDLFPESLGLFYSRKDYDTYLISNVLIKYRAANALWVPEKKIDYLNYWDKLLSHHYSNILEINKDVIPFDFKLKTIIKKMIRRIRILYIKIISFKP